MQWCSDQNPNFVLRDWPGKQWRAERQACHYTRLTARFSQTVKPFWRLILSIFCFLNVSFPFKNSTLLCWQNRIFVDMSYFLKIAVLSPFLSTKRLSTTALLLIIHIIYTKEAWALYHKMCTQQQIKSNQNNLIKSIQSSIVHGYQWIF